MKKTFFSMPNALLLHALTTFLVGIGCTYPLSLSLGLTAPLSLSVGCCALVTLAFALLSCLPRLRALAYPLLLAVLCAFVFSLRGQMNAISAALTLLLNGHALALAAYSRALVVLFSLVFTGVGAALSRSDQAFFPLALLVIVLLFIVSFLGIEVGAFSLLPLVLALILSGRAPGVSAKRLIPMGSGGIGHCRADDADGNADRARTERFRPTHAPENRRLSVLHRASNDIFAQHNRLSAAGRQSARRTRQSGGNPRDAGSHKRQNASARRD